MAGEDYTRLADHYELPMVDGATLYLKNQLTPRIKADYQSWIVGNARRDVFELALREPSGDVEADKRRMEDFDMAYERHQTFVASGSFNWGGKCCLSSLNQMPGLIKMVGLLAAACGKTPLTAERCGQLFKSLATVKLVTKAIQEIMESSPNFLVPPELELMTV